MSAKDIEKLKEKVDKDPQSKLFVPLAEEYRKEGMHDDAINVLLKGIENQPGYTSARVSLGKMYLEKGMFEEARAEFENVIQVIPDNLYAYKKLAEIYRDTGERDKAIKAFKTVLRLNPMDEDAADQVKEIEGITTEKTYTEDSPAAQRPQSAEIPSTAAGEAAAKASAEAPRGPGALEEVFSEEGSESSEVSVEPVELAEDEISFDEAGGGLAYDELKLEEPVELAEDEISFDEAGGELVDDETSFGVLDQDLQMQESEIVKQEKPAPVSTTMEEVSAEDVQPAAVAEPPENGGTLDDANRFISEGNFLDAMGVYKRILSSDPHNKEAMQRVQELRALLKLMGKDKEALISMLNVFLEGINKRRDEFYRSA